MDKDDPEAKGSDTGGRREEKEDSKMKTTTGETLRDPKKGEGKMYKENTVGSTDIKYGGEVQSSEIQIGTLNISGIAFSYRGKYMKTEEELLKIRPGDKLREVTEMMKTQ
eukprot:541690-Pleurochrysis_carterae.AAC.1